jgi:hypothetical protein
MTNRIGTKRAIQEKNSIMTSGPYQRKYGIRFWKIFSAIEVGTRHFILKFYLTKNAIPWRLPHCSRSTLKIVSS